MSNNNKEENFESFNDTTVGQVFDRLRAENGRYLMRLRNLEEEINKVVTPTQGMTLEGAVRFLMNHYINNEKR